MKKCMSALNQIVETLGGLLILAMTLIVLLQVIARYVFHAPLTWTEEMARYLFVYITFLGAGILLYQRSHLFVEVVFDQLKGAFKRVIQLVIDVIVAVFSGYLLYSGILLTKTATAHSSTAMNIPMNFISLSVVIGAALMVLFALYNIYLDVRKLADPAFETETTEGGEAK